MPYVTGYVEPEVFCEVDGVTIYHLYRDGTDDRLNYNFSTTSDEEDIGRHFDVRDLAAILNERNPDYQIPVYNPYYSPPQNWTGVAKQQVIADALLVGLLPVSGELAEWVESNFEERYKRYWVTTANLESNFEELPRRYEVPDDLPDHAIPDG